MPSVSERLREERLKQGRDLGQIAAEIRVNQSYLEAIEEGRLDQLPGGFFARSFIRQYAQLLGIPYANIKTDTEAWLKREEDDNQPNLEPKTMKTRLAPVAHVMVGGRKPRRHVFGALAGLVVVVGGCAALYSLWLRGPGTEAPPILPEEPEEIAAVTPAAPVPDPPPEAPSIPEGETDQEGILTETPEISPSPETTGGEESEGALWFEIRAIEETWVRVKAGDRTLFVGILEDGESRRFSGLSLATMRVGNAGGLMLSTKGAPAQPVGPRGNIRIVTLTPGSVDIQAPPQVPRTPVPVGEDQTG